MCSIFGASCLLGLITLQTIFDASIALVENATEELEIRVAPVLPKPS